MLEDASCMWGGLVHVPVSWAVWKGENELSINIQLFLLLECLCGAVS